MQNPTDYQNLPVLGWKQAKSNLIG